jgi:hypothetical protein
MTTSLRLSTAIERIRQRGALLVYPINNRREPRSLWHEFFPDSQMVWDWNEDADTRVAQVWQLMKQLSDCRQVVYSKWYRGRATFFSLELFAAMLRVRARSRDPRHILTDESRRILEILENNSPISTRELKRFAELQGRENEPAYARAMKELFTSLLIVGFGEVDDGAFPSALVGATELLFGALCREAEELALGEARKVVDRFMPDGTHFRRFLEEL